MTKQVLLDVRTFLSGADLSGSGNKIELQAEWEAKAVTNWKSGGAEENIAGLGKTEIGGEGQWEAGSTGLPDDAFWANRRQLEPWSIGPNGQSDTSVGSLMYLTRALRTKVAYWGSVGDVASWNAQAVGSWPLVRGVSAHPSGTARSATGSGTSIQLGAVTADQHLYANLHVLSVSGTSGPSITAEIESDSATGFPSPTSRGSFAAKTAAGGESIRIAGPFTDDWWRVKWTITGSTPSFLFLVTMGIE